MTTSPADHCLNCNTAEADIPLVQWQYQGRHLWICADCLPLMIHKRHQLAEKLSALDESLEEG
ncbi:MAG: hypothetical protein HYZ49_13040 [Chloroflexi bacterium]|nr:hypothetical protein [Chloroflexota bacterium]